MIHNKRALVSLAAILLVMGVFVAVGAPYGRFHWSNLVWAQDDAIYGSEEPGCEIDIPAGSVVGSFNSNAMLYWEPLVSSGSGYSVGNPPKTAWVIGLDSSKSFYKIIWACQYLWVLEDTLNPNPDAVWQNTPLPTRTVK